MRAYDIITKKRDGAVHSLEEIRFMVEGYVQDRIPDYQMSAWLMAICIQGMNQAETASLTQVVASSGRQVDLSSVGRVIADKHSTGGVGDKATLIVVPMVAAVGAKIAKISGRGLGHTGGTLDKLESIPGLKVDLTEQQLVGQVKEIGVVIASASSDIAPAEEKIYALRDVTATVASAPLIASSIMSKKIAGGANRIILDVTCGSGAFMKTLEEARELARLMVNIGKDLGKKMVAVLSDMNQPLGRAVGNSLELKEAIGVLKSQGPEDVRELCLVLGSHMLVLAEIAPTLDEAGEMLEEAISSGAALAKFGQLIEAQGGNSDVVSNVAILPQAKMVVQYRAKQTGYISSMATEKIGTILVDLGDGRLTKQSKIDSSAGLVFHRKLADFVKPGDLVAEIHASDKKKAAKACQVLEQSIALTNQKPRALPLVYDTIT